MKNYRRYWFPLLGLIILSLGLLVACFKPGYAKYTSKDLGYIISYPYNWQIEITEDKTVCVLKSPNRRASVRIDVIKAMKVQDAANRWIMAIAEGTPGKEVTRIEDKPMQGSWDWYLSYDYETEYGVTFHGEAYFKQTETQLYKIDTAAPENEYKNYGFKTIVSTFKLL